MQVADAQREVRTVLWEGSGAIVCVGDLAGICGAGNVGTPRSAILELIVCGFFIFPATQLLLHLAGGPASLSKGNPLGKLGMQIAFTLPMTMLLLAPVVRFG